MITYIMNLHTYIMNFNSAYLIIVIIKSSDRIRRILEKIWIKLIKTVFSLKLFTTNALIFPLNSQLQYPIKCNRVYIVKKYIS